MQKQIYTISAGRTGTAWLASFLECNVSREARSKIIHEPLNARDFGVSMPDIRLMRLFNDEGNVPEVQSFWARKFRSITADLYAETNHTLAKVGLLENAQSFREEIDFRFICLSRDIEQQACSYLARHDFSNMTIAWQWYLDPSYRRNLVNPAQFLKFGMIGLVLWYCREMEVRQLMYMNHFQDVLKIHHCELSHLVDSEQSRRELSFFLGVEPMLIVPPPKNEGSNKLSDGVVRKVREINLAIGFDSKEVLKNHVR